LSGLTYARIVNIISPYSFEFEDGQYAVVTVGANHNIIDVKIQNQVSVVTQNSAGLINNPSSVEIATEVDKRLQYKLESTSTHQGTGDWFYVDPVSGDDSYDGTAPTIPSAGSLVGPTLTFAAAMAKASRHDVIYLIKTGATVTLTENIVIDKEVHVRGPGPGFIIAPSDNTVSTVRITAPHASLTNFSVVGDPLGSATACVECTSSEPLIRKLVIYDGNSHGVYLSSAVTDFVVSDCLIHDNLGAGIRSQEAVIGKILGGRSYGCSTGIHLAAGSPVDGFVVIDGTYVYDNTSSGIEVDAGYAKSVISGSTYFTNNGSAQVGGAADEWDIINNEPSTKLVANFYSPDDKDALFINASDAAVLPLV